MKTNLSSQIKLDRVPRSFFAPQGEIQRATLTREEKIYTRIFETVDDGSEYVARHIAEIVGQNVAAKRRCVLALGTGRSTHPVYNELVKLYNEGKIDFTNVIVFSLAEFYPLIPEGPSTTQLLRRLLLDHVNIRPENIHIINPTGSIDDMYDYCMEYQRCISDLGGIDLTVCQVGPDGNLGYNQSGSLSTSRCRVVLLSNEMRHAVKSTFKTDACPPTAITLGMADILASKNIICMAWGNEFSSVIQRTVEGPVTDATPASFLQLHSSVRLAVDIDAADSLTRISHPWIVASCEWTPKLIRRAIVWLCEKTGKPILKLTNKDYNDWGLGELVALYGSAYNVNIKVFNELQHTITGWPGGKPNADDTSRPERATPYPKRVVVFSPHPDDDVISMGGTLKRLADQGHELHVAYETSGNIAVGDEDMMRYFLMMDKIAPAFGFDNEAYNELSKTVADFVKNKNTAETDIPQVRTIKTMIRQAEATIACHYVGIPDEHIHFLRLPFYETGRIQKAPLSRKDVDIVKNLLQQIQPHQIFVAGDLSDPHGTHRVCTDAVLAAIDELRNQPWMQECRIWMYRGAWAEWEIDHIEMAVPISPEELRAKRNAILKHQSQMENAPFLGDDDRLFWQRAEDRNRATAKMYEDLGLASYEAMEAFVRYIPLTDTAEEK